jgi:hypothetical protein
MFGRKLELHEDPDAPLIEALAIIYRSPHRLTIPQSGIFIDARFGTHGTVAQDK